MLRYFVTEIYFPQFQSLCAVHMKETYKNMTILLSEINYDDYQWRIC